MQLTITAALWVVKAWIESCNWHKVNRFPLEIPAGATELDENGREKKKTEGLPIVLALAFVIITVAKIVFADDLLMSVAKNIH